MIPHAGIKITPEVAAHVLWWFGQGGYSAGSFVEALLRAFSAADSSNWNRLATGFPALANAMWMVKNGKLDELKEIFQGGVS